MNGRALHLHAPSDAPLQRRGDGYLFVSGCKRSATEFLNHCLDGHPRLLNVGVEFYAFEYSEKFPDHISEILAFAFTAPVEDVYNDFKHRQFLPCYDEKNLRPGLWPDELHGDEAYFRMGFDKVQFLKVFAATRCKAERSLPGLIHAWFGCLRQVPPFSKAPANARWLLKCADFGSTLLAAFRLGLLDRAIFNVRHPLAILNSLKRLRMSETHRQFHIFELLEVCLALEKVPETVRNLDGKVDVLRFEDFIGKPKPQLKRLCRHWGFEYDSALDTPSLFGENWERNTSFQDDRENRQVLTDWEIEMALRTTHNFRKAFGYGEQVK